MSFYGNFIGRCFVRARGGFGVLRIWAKIFGEVGSLFLGSSYYSYGFLVRRFCLFSKFVVKRIEVLKNVRFFRR